MAIPLLRGVRGVSIRIIQKHFTTKILLRIKPLRACIERRRNGGVGKATFRNILTAKRIISITIRNIFTIKRNILTAIRIVLTAKGIISTAKRNIATAKRNITTAFRNITTANRIIPTSKKTKICKFAVNPFRNS